MTHKITAIILNYKNPNDTIKCVRSLQGSEAGRGISYLIVDNSTDNGVVKMLNDALPEVPCLVHSANKGFAGGNNPGIKEALIKGAQYILIINPDVRVGKSFIKPLLKNFDGDEKVGIVAPAIRHRQKGNTVYGLEGKVDWHLGKPEHRNQKNIEETGPISAEFVTFACVLIKASTFEKVGLLDERFFMYCEDVDFCLRAKKKGIKIILDPTVVVDHNTSSSFSRPTQKLPISFKSHLLFVLKWLKFPQSIMPLLYVFLLYPYLYLLWSFHSLKYKDR